MTQDDFSRLAYLASERGGTLTASADGSTFAVTLAVNSSVVLGPAASLADTEAWCSNVDPNVAEEIAIEDA